LQAPARAGNTVALIVARALAREIGVPSRVRRAAGHRTVGLELATETEIMNFYEMLAARVGSPEARQLANELSAWHDETVLHRRRAIHEPLSVPCSADCPYHEAPSFWNAARHVFGDAARELTFLRSLVAAGIGRTQGRRMAPDGGSPPAGPSPPR
jgi:hypothetical protein